MLTIFSLILWTDPSCLMSATPTRTHSLVGDLSMDGGDQTDPRREGDRVVMKYRKEGGI